MSAQDRLLLFVEQGLGDMLQFCALFAIGCRTLSSGGHTVRNQALVSLFR